MLIDWFTVGAQIANFLVLVWLLKRFLYKPVLDAIDAREARIGAELAEAAATRTAAEREREEFQRKSAALDEQRGAILNGAAGEAKLQREALLAQAHQAADALRVQYETGLRKDHISLNRAITRLAQEEVFAIARKALADLAAADLEDRMGAAFTRQLREMDPQMKESLAAALKESSESVLRSAFDIPAARRATIQEALGDIFATDVHLRFETSPDTVCGIEWRVGDQKLAWSIAEYLANLGEKVTALVDAQSLPDPRSAASVNTPNSVPP